MNPKPESVQNALTHRQRFAAIIDVRTPAEYAEDHIPGAINVPVLDNDERVIVGTLHRTDPFAARKMGAALIARKIADHLDRQFSAHDRNWNPLIYCWRGGQRSGSMATILARVGWQVTLLEGGYRDFRRHVHESLVTLPSQFHFRVLCGVTGSGKSRILQALAEHPDMQVLDLEAIACHRGSVLGVEPALRQPTQKAFETQLWAKLHQFDPSRPVYVESESKRIGKLHVPDSLMSAIRHGQCISVDTAMPVRVQLLCQDYQHFIDDRQRLLEPLQALVPLHGHERIQEWLTMIQAEHFELFVQDMLQTHYDPLYLRSMPKNYVHFSEAQRVVLAGADPASYQAAAEALMALPPGPEACCETPEGPTSGESSQG